LSDDLGHHPSVRLITGYGRTHWLAGAAGLYQLTRTSTLGRHWDGNLTIGFEILLDSIGSVDRQTFIELW
jgi:hypothetical protein